MDHVTEQRKSLFLRARAPKKYCEVSCAPLQQLGLLRSECSVLSPGKKCLPSELQMYLQWEMPSVPELPPSMSTAFIPHLNIEGKHSREKTLYKLVENEIFAEKTFMDLLAGVAAKRHHAPILQRKLS